MRGVLIKPRTNLDELFIDKKYIEVREVMDEDKDVDCLGMYHNSQHVNKDKQSVVCHRLTQAYYYNAHAKDWCACPSASACQP